LLTPTVRRGWGQGRLLPFCRRNRQFIEQGGPVAHTCMAKRDMQRCGMAHKAHLIQNSATRPTTPRAGSGQTRRVVLRDDGRELPPERSRRPPDEIAINPACTGAGQPWSHCAAPGLATAPPSRMPRCWNYNDSIDALGGCRAPSDGTPLPLCFEFGYTQTALVVECGGEWEDHPHCGTFLEIHRPGDTAILSSVKLKAVLTSGYRSGVISTTWQRHTHRVLCYDLQRLGRYEVRSQRCKWSVGDGVERGMCTHLA